ncbi:MAG: phosphatase PAP2 family protein [bacterium]
MTVEPARAAARSRIGATVTRFLSARVDRHSAVGRRLTLGIVVFAAAVWAFSGLLEEVLDNDALVGADRFLNAWSHQHVTSGGLAVFNALTALGSVGVWATVLVVGAWLWRGGHHVLLTAWLGTNVGGVLVQLILKQFVHRGRPEYAGAYLHGHTYSFPSGHAMQSTIAYVMLVFVASMVSPWWRTHQRPLFVIAVLLVLLTSFSRVYLGVHYPSDVIGGVVAGTAWLSAALVLLGVARDRSGSRSSGIADINTSS